MNANLETLPKLVRDYLFAQLQLCGAGKDWWWSEPNGMTLWCPLVLDWGYRC